MVIKELIYTMRVCASDEAMCSACPRYEKFPFAGSPVCSGGLMYEAADTIESQEKRIAELENKIQEREKMLTLDELKHLSLNEWVWVEVLQKRSGLRDESAYYRKCIGWKPENTFVCGYPGWSTAFDYADYGVTWLSYRSKPKEWTNGRLQIMCT